MNRTSCAPSRQGVINPAHLQAVCSCRLLRFTSAHAYCLACFYFLLSEGLLIVFACHISWGAAGLSGTALRPREAPPLPERGHLFGVLSSCALISRYVGQTDKIMCCLCSASPCVVISVRPTHALALLPCTSDSAAASIFTGVLGALGVCS